MQEPPLSGGSDGAFVHDRRVDARWPTAADWLAAGPGGRAVDLAVLGVPTFATSISPTGAHATPAAVRRHLARLSTWSVSRGLDLADLAPLDLGDVDDPDEPDKGAGRVRAAVRAAVEQARLLIAIGGDNSATFPVLAGQPGLDTAGLVTLDAHHDFREGHSNGSPVRELIDAGLDPARVVQIGIADWANSRSYYDELVGLGATVMTLAEVELRGIDECFDRALDIAGGAQGAVHVDLDLDVCDRSVAPACPASLPGGLAVADVLAVAAAAGEDPRVRSIDITEVDATRDAPDERTVRLAALCILEAAAGLASRS
jgi:formiminoglutamase